MTRSVINKNQISQEEQYKRSLYKLYKDTQSKPKKTKFLNELLLGLCSVSGGLSVNLLSNELIGSKLLVALGGFMTVASLVEGISYNIDKKEFKLSEKRLNKFKELAKQKIDDNKISFEKYDETCRTGLVFPSQDSFSMFTIKLDDNYIISEEFQNSSYNCVLYKDDKEVMNLSEEVKMAYSIGSKD